MKAFIETLREIREGELLSELPAKVQDLVAAVQTTQKAGKIVITLNLRHTKKGGMLLLEDDVKLVLPEPDKDTTTFFFVTEDNDLTRRDPRQPTLPGVRGPASVMPSTERESNG